MQILSLNTDEIKFEVKMMGYVDFETPKELVPQIAEMLSVAKESGKLKKGINEATKAIERKTAQFVILAGDVSPEEIVVHIIWV